MRSQQLCAAHTWLVLQLIKECLPHAAEAATIYWACRGWRCFSSAGGPCIMRACGPTGLPLFRACCRCSSCRCVPIYPEVGNPDDNHSRGSGNLHMLGQFDCGQLFWLVTSCPPSQAAACTPTLLAEIKRACAVDAAAPLLQRQFLFSVYNHPAVDYPGGR